MRLPKQHRSNQAVLVTTLLVLLCCALPVRAEDTKPTSAAGTDFYFTFLDHWRGKKTNDGQQQMDAIVCATKQTSVTVKGSNGYTRSYSINENSSQVIPLTSAVSPLEGIHIQTTEPCYATAWVHGSTCASESAILPKHLLGTLYMLQGTPGDIIELDYVPTKTYSQFTVVGTEDGTTVTIKVKVPLTCVTTGKEIDPQASFTLAANQVLLFQPGDHTQDISGTIVESDKPVAVFQGNNLTRIPVEVKWTDYTWEQARPVSSWGKEFFIPKCTKLQHNIAQITAFYDNTVVSYQLNGMNFLKEMQSGESWELSLTNPVNQLQVVHVQASQPVCCYLYLTGCTENDEIGDPSMAEIVPVDNWATEARFSTTYNNRNTPYSSYLFVTTKEEEKDYIKIDGSTISAYSAQKGGASVVTDGYVTYQIPVAQNGGAVLKAEKGGFSAYLLKLGNVAEAAAFNISLPYTVPEEELCMDGTLLFREDFGGNDPNDPIVGTDKVPGMDYTNYTQRLNADHVTGQPGLFWLIKSGYYHADTTNGRDPMKNHSNWYLQDDHTYPNDKSRGYLLEIDGKGGKAPFYSTVISDLCPASRLTFSAYVANVNKASNYIDGVHARIYPRLRFELTDAETGDFLADHSTGDIPYDPDLTVNTDFWYSSKWYLHGMNFEVPPGVSSIRLTIYNDVENNGAGNDFALDDIEIRLCAPPVTIEGPDGVCKGNSAELTAHFENDGTFAEPLEYTWLYSSTGKPNGTWTNIGTWDNENGLGMWMNIVNEKNAGWYKFMVAGSGNSANGHCRVVSEPYLLRLKTCSSHNQNLCMDGTLLFREDFGGNDPDDPSVSTATVPGMDSRYSNTGVNGGMGSWRYTIRKEGYTNGIQWHLQDDHTCPDDKNRGYFLEIDGGGGDIPFYSKTIDGLCAGSVLTFSAYVINVHYAGQIQWFYENNRGYVYPRLKFVLIDPSTGTTLANESTGDILPDYSKIWDISLKESAEWQLVGTTFQVPIGVESIQMYIYNDVSTNGNGNDFALDDIEIRVCLNASIEGQHEVCENEPVKLTASSPDFSPLTNPAYRWYFSADSLTWTELDEQTYALTRTACRKDAHEGWYRVAIAGTGNIDRENCRAMSEPFRLRVKDDCEPPKEELCMDGTLLFREDFGGNDPNDPRIQVPPEGEKSTVPGMSDSYRQLTTDAYPSMGSGRYLVTKSGYCNGDTTGWTLPGADLSGQRSQWYIQDDHTYPDDYSRGYFLEIDGSGGSQQFYETEISGLCAGSELTFSAYVANVFAWFQYDWHTKYRGPVVAPGLKFVLTDPTNGTVLAAEEMPSIPFDESLPAKTDWQYSSTWHLVGMNFTVPTGVEAVRLSIYNNVNNGNGNDFAIDDIEVRLCVPPVKIVSEPEACEGSPHSLKADFTNDGSFAEPLEYKWYFSSDSLTWTELPEKTGTLTYAKCKKTEHEGWYRAAVADSENIDKENCRAMSEPFRLRVKDNCEPPKEELCMDGTLLFREDFGGNDPSDPRLVSTPADIPGMTYEQLLTDRFGTMKSGGFLITKEGYCNGDTSVTNPARGSQWHLQDDHTYPGDKTRGYFLEIDGRGDHAAFYTRTIDMLCEGTRLTFSAYVANVVKWNEYTGRPGYFAYPRLEFVLTDPDGNKLKSYDTGDIPFDSTYLNDFSSWQYSSKWHLVGMNFEVPEGVSSVTLTIYNNVEGWIGNDFALDDIEIRLCVPPVTIEGPNEVCLDAKPTLTAHFDNDGTFSNPDYQWYFSTDSAGFYNEIDPAMALTYTIENAQKADEGWYRIGISERGQMAYMNCRAISEPFHLTVKECEREEVTITEEITVCEDELPYTWHGHEFTEAEEKYTYTEYTATQAITYIYTLHTKYCPPPCPDILVPIVEDSTICGYALPFVWHDAVFDRPSTQTVIEKNERGCDTFVYTLTVDTVYCVRRYPIIVNKYNWVLLVDNIAVRRLFPDKTPVAYQWYKDDEPVAGATEDDYSEQNELHGVFSMLLHFADGSSVWSNIIDLSRTPTAAPVRVKAYNSSGILVREWQATEEQGGLSLPPGIYLLRYEGGDEVFTEKRIVP